MEWEPYARQLADQVAHPVSRWRPIIAAVPRHRFVPHWWAWRYRQNIEPEFELATPQDRQAWLTNVYDDRSLITQVGPHHADHASPGEVRVGHPTSSATLPSLLVQMFRHAFISDGMNVLDVGTGSGYGTALLATCLGDGRVTSIDVDPYLTQAARDRLAELGLHPHLITADATGTVLGTYDRIIATVSVRPVPRTWLEVLRPGGRLVTTIAETALILTADMNDDGTASGRIEWDRAGFMHTRSGPAYKGVSPDMWARAREDKGEDITSGRYPLVNVPESWDLWSTLGVLHPGIEHHYEEDERTNTRTAYMVHQDGSWARATSRGGTNPVVHQGGPRRLWDLLDGLREMWLREGSLPVYGAKADIAKDGTIRLRRGRWEATLT
ncbi:methyltransferase domain-containing protein [Bailinhaonella thermotolerans]|uniref:Protein-L-isoaspartate O-methyltransferase n=1 Tax=Bailinhaonella thermotolerans TaxID=1070861 RepID=A0A3A4A642_9ACTN|nr:methyltransferase domain-containing protein [Bailinhaonella thermotolerans]RJL24035.1 methyltransferase domain-containing protein [Bailinhaonella thermotolerans]